MRPKGESGSPVPRLEGGGALVSLQLRERGGHDVARALLECVEDAEELLLTKALCLGHLAGVEEDTGGIKVLCVPK